MTTLQLTDEEKIERRRESQRRYKSSANGQEMQRQYRASPKWQEYRQQYREQTSSAPKHKARWTVEEVREAFNLSLTDTEIAKRLDRSMQAVSSARLRHPELAPPGWRAKKKKGRQSDQVQTEAR